MANVCNQKFRKYWKCSILDWQIATFYHLLLSPENIIEKILDEISFTATDRAGEKIIINKEYINKNLDNLVKDTDLSKFIL